MDKLVSTIIPTYNAKSFVKQAIDSALKQTYSYIEIIVVDDGSTDGTQEALQQYVKSGKIRYFYKKNGGPAKARNFGAKKAKGKYLAFLDADESWYSKKIEIQLKQGGDGKTLVLANSLNKEIETGYSRKIINEFTYDPKEDIINLFLNKYHRITSSILVPKDKFFEIGGFNKTLKLREDFFFIMSYIKKFPYSNVNQILETNFVHPRSYTRTMDHKKKLPFNLRFIRLATQKFSFLKKFESQAYSQVYLEVALDYYLSNIKIPAIKLSFKAIISCPTNLTAYIVLFFSILPINSKYLVKLKRMVVG